jgi:hypothetical protein
MAKLTAFTLLEAAAVAAAAALFLKDDKKACSGFSSENGFLFRISNPLTTTKQRENKTNKETLNEKRMEHNYNHFATRECVNMNELQTVYL